MRKLFTAVALMGLISLGATPMMAQEAENAPVATALEQDSTTAAVETPAIAEEESNEVAEQSLHHQLKTKFIEGGPGFMATVLLCLILGLAVAIERIIYLSLASVNTKKLLTNVENALQSGGVEAAKKVCADTRGPVASIFSRVSTASTRALMLLRKQWYPTARYRLANLRAACRGLVCSSALLLCSDLWVL